MKKCIICDREHSDETVEHIVPNSLGNIHYVLRKGLVCGKCNNRFSRFEHHVVNSEPWISVRKQQGLVNKPSDLSAKETEEHKEVLFLMKILYESLYLSRPGLLEFIDLSEVKKALNKGMPKDYELFHDKALNHKTWIPGWWDRWILRMNRIHLAYQHDNSSLYFYFRYATIDRVLRVPCSSTEN